MPAAIFLGAWRKNGQMNLQPHLHMMYEMRYLTKPVFEDYMTFILTVDDLEHMKCQCDDLQIQIFALSTIKINFN